jgi:hypothetical protein
MHEREVLNTWRDLFRGKKHSTEVLAKAEQLLSGLSGESPLHLRLAAELSELKGSHLPQKKRPTRRSST